MKVTGSLFTLLIGAGSTLATFPLSQISRSSSGAFVPGKFIIEVEHVSQIPSKRGLVSRSPHEFVYEHLRKRGVGFDIGKEFNLDGIFTGASLTLTNPKDITALAATPGIVAIRPVVSYPAPKTVDNHVIKDRSDPHCPVDTESTHIMTNVNKLHAQGYFGQGVKIGIIDTGIDYNHPFLGKGFGPGHKVIGGYDFVGDAYNGSNAAVPDADPMDNCNGHGTHVAGIIGADPGNPFNISGVAYRASISAYRIFGCAGSTLDDVIIEAMLRAVVEKQDIITMSLGGSDGWTEGAGSVVASRIAAAGTIVTIAAGNDGAFGSWYSSGPGNAINGISVASIDNTAIPIQNATVVGVTHDPIPYYDALPFPVTAPLPVYALSTDTTIPNDACNPLPDSTPDLSKSIVIIRRGTCTFVQKLTNAAAKGMKVALIYDNGNGFRGIEVGNFTASIIQAADGEFLVQQFAAKANIRLSFPQSGASFNLPDPHGGLVSSFSSYGPSNDMYFKPAVAAPGGNILSTIPLALGEWGVKSGTSMATPFVAGSSALLIQGRGKSIAKTARSLLETTAQRVPSSRTDGDPLQTLSQAGAGLIDVFKAVHTSTIVSPGELLLNDTAHFKSTHQFKIANNGWWPKTYKISHVPAGTATTIAPGTIFASTGPVPLTSQYATVTFSQKKAWVLPFFPAKITATITPPAGVDAATLPVYSGFIEVSSDGESLHVSYMGVAASLKDKQLIDNTNVFVGVNLPTLLDSTGNPQVGVVNYTLAGIDAPALINRLAFGTADYRVDLVSASATIKTTFSKRGGSKDNSAQVPIIGQLQEFNYIPRNSDSGADGDNGYNSFTLTNLFANGTAIPNGSYKMLFRVLKVTGDKSNEADYESWLSPAFNVRQ